MKYICIDRPTVLIEINNNAEAIKAKTFFQIANRYNSHIATFSPGTEKGLVKRWARLLSFYKKSASSK